MKKSKINNGTFTLINRETNTYVTLKVNTSLNGNLKGKRIISKLVGRDNENSYKGMAFVNADDTISLWRKYNSPKNAQTMAILKSLAIDGSNSRFADKVNMELSKRCLRCNRKLTTPKSIADGIGPECIKKNI